MISDSASIDAKKLDIESLFTVMNDDETYTLNVTKIWIDSEKQSLGAKLTSITENASTLDTKIVATNGRIDTVISSTNNQIDSINTTINQVITTVDENTLRIQDVTTTQEGIFTEISEIRQTADQISFIVSENNAETGLVLTPEALNAIARDINFTASDALSMMVVGSDGQSLMTQTDAGWVYNIGNLKDSVENMENYVYIGEYDSAPCIELGQKIDDSFKLRISNKEVQFLEGDYKTAYMNNHKLYVEQAEVLNELQFGDFIWKKRHRGNMGLLWIGE